MNITIVGAGNVATVLVKLLHSNNHKILKIINRNESHAQALADIANTDYGGMDSDIHKDSEIIILAVADKAINSVLQTLKLNNKLTLHTAGAVSMEGLKNHTDNFGVLYPVQSLRKEIDYLPKIPFLINANDVQNIEIVTKLASSISDNVQKAEDELRLAVHAAAVLVSNFTNHLYTQAEIFCEEKQIDFNILKPLIEETATRLKYFSAKNMQTGPAIREDLETMNTHLKLFGENENLKKLYSVLSESIMNMQHRKC